MFPRPVLPVISTALVMLEEKPAAIAFDALLASFRSRNFRAKYDPVGATACRRMLIKPVMDALTRNEAPALALIWPANESERRQTVQLIVSHCRNCGLCPKAKIAALMPPARLAGCKSESR